MRVEAVFWKIPFVKFEKSLLLQSQAQTFNKNWWRHNKQANRQKQLNVFMKIWSMQCITNNNYKPWIYVMISTGMHEGEPW